MELLERIMFIVGLLVLIILGIKRKKIKETGNYRLAIAMVCIAGGCLIGGRAISETRYLVKFNSPEDAYQYIFLEKDSLVIEGKETAFIVGNEESIIVERDGDGWRIPVSWMTSPKCDKQVGTINIYVIQYNLSNEYYLRISDSEGEQLEIMDNRNSKFIKDEWKDKVLNKKVIDYWGYVDDLDAEYTISINGEEINLIE